MTLSTAGRRFALSLSVVLVIVVVFATGDRSVVAAAARATTADTSAEAVPQGAPADGDFTWELAGRGIFADQRVRMALVLLLDEDVVMSAAGLDGQPLGYREPDLQQAIAGVPVSDAELLLAAAGLAMPGKAVPLAQARPCRIWTPTDGATLDDREAIASALADEVVRVFAALGVSVEPCEMAGDAADADFVVSAANLERGLPELVDPDPDAFVLYREPSPGHLAGEAPQPGAGGTGGLSSNGNSGGSQPAIGILLAAALIVVGRSRTTNRSRSSR